MRVRILRDFATANRSYVAGQIENIDPRKAEGWLRAGLVMQDKSLDGPKETKEAEAITEPPPAITEPVPVKPKGKRLLPKSKKRTK